MRTAIALQEEDNMPVKQKGRVTRKNGSSKLYVDFCYNGIRIEKSTGIVDTPANRKKVRQWLDRQVEKIAEGRFVFAEAFPGASDEEKKFHATREGWDYHPEPHDVLFGDYVQSWLDRVWSKYPSAVKRRDYLQIIECWLLPYFSDKTFDWITGVRLQEFVAELRWLVGKNMDRPLSPSRIRNILIPLRAIWNDACEEHRWDLRDPFRFIARHIPKVRKKQPEVFRFEEWKRVLETINPYYVPHAEVMVMTGLIASEMAGLRREDVTSDHLLIRNSIVRGQEKDTLKTEYRRRRIPLTNELRRRIDSVLVQSSGRYVFTMKSGIPFSESSFRNNIWKPALKRAGVVYKVPYTTRHTFTAWSLIIGKNKEKVVGLMGHGSREMVDRVYGHYLEGLEEDAISILEYFGPDYIEEERKLAMRINPLSCERNCESQPS